MVRALLDTNIAIRILNQDLDVLPLRDRGIETFLSLTVVGELLYGASKSRQPEANRRRVATLIEICPVLQLDLETAEHYGRLKKPENDVWIAASALRFGLVLATRDQHFERAEGLQVESW